MKGRGGFFLVVFVSTLAALAVRPIVSRFTGGLV